MILAFFKKIRSEQFWKERLITGLITATYAIGNIIELLSGKIAEDPPFLWITAIIIGVTVIVVSITNFKRFTYYFFYTFLLWINIHSAVTYAFANIKHREAEEFYLLISYVVFIVITQIVDSSRALLAFCVFHVIIFAVAVYSVHNHDPLLLHPIQLLMFGFVVVGSYAIGYLRIMRTQINPNSNIQFKSVSENARDGQVIIDAEMKFAYLNPAATVITGYTIPQLSKVKMTDLIESEDVPLVKDALTQILSGAAEKLNIQYRIISASGKSIWVESILSAFSASSFVQSKLVFAETRDISDRKKLEEETHQQLLAEELLVKHSNLFINIDRTEIQQNIAIALQEFASIIQADGILVYRMLGKINEEFRSTNHWFSPDQQSIQDKFNYTVKINQKLITFLRSLKSEKSTRGLYAEASELFEIQVLRTGIFAGKKFFLVPLPSGNVVNGFIIIIFDEHHEPSQTNFFSLIGNMVSNAFTRLRTETRLHEVQLTSEFILRALPDWLYIIDKEGHFTGVNNYTTLKTYLPDYDLVGKHLNDVLSEDILPKFQSALSSIIEFENPVSFEYEDKVNYAGQYLKATLAPFKENEYLIIIRDISDLKKAQIELEAKAEKLEKSNQELEQFAYIVSHDMKQPIRSIISFLGLLNRKHGVLLNEEAQEYIRYSMESANKMDNLIKDILQYSRLDRQIEFVDTVDLNKVLKSVLSALSDTINSGNASVEVMPLPAVLGNETMLYELFQNLIENGIKYNSNPMKKVEVKVSEQDADWLFEISDNGIGFDEQHSKQIFKIFKRLHTDTEFQGTGIGLTICQKVVEKHGGKIWANSKTGLGSKFYFTLPKKEVAAIG